MGGPRACSKSSAPSRRSSTCRGPSKHGERRRALFPTVKCAPIYCGRCRGRAVRTSLCCHLVCLPLCCRGLVCLGLPTPSRGMGVTGIAAPGFLGLLHRRFRFLDRHLARRNADLCDSASDRRRLAQTGDARRRSHYRLCAHDRRHVSDHSPGPRLGFLLADSVSEFAAVVAQFPLAACCGILPRSCTYRDGQRDLSVPAADSRHGAIGAAHTAVAAPALPHAFTRLDRQRSRVARTRTRHEADGRQSSWP